MLIIRTSQRGAFSTTGMTVIFLSGAIAMIEKQAKALWAQAHREHRICGFTIHGGAEQHDFTEMQFHACLDFLDYETFVYHRFNFRRLKLFLLSEVTCYNRDAAR